MRRSDGGRVVPPSGSDDFHIPLGGYRDAGRTVPSSGSAHHDRASSSSTLGIAADGDFRHHLPPVPPPSVSTNAMTRSEWAPWEEEDGGREATADDRAMDGQPLARPPIHGRIHGHHDYGPSSSDGGYTCRKSRLPSSSAPRR